MNVDQQEPADTATVEAPAAGGDPHRSPAEQLASVRLSPDEPATVRRTMRVARRILVHEWTVVSLIALALAVIMTWPTIRQMSTTIPASTRDPMLQSWQLAWAGHAMLTDPTHLWDSNAFYPNPDSYAYSDTLFGYFPFGLIGVGPTAALIRYNILFILVFALAFVGGYALLRQLGVGRAAAAVAGAALAYAPWRWSQAEHMHVLSVGGIALSLAMLARGHGFSFTRGYQPRLTRPGWAVAGWCVAAWQISLGFGIGLPFVYVLVGIVIVSTIRWLRAGRPHFGRRLLRADGIGVLVFGAVGVFMGLPYLHVIQQHPEARRTLKDVAFFSWSIREFVTAPAQSLPWGALHEAARTNMGTTETTLLPGFVLYGLAAAGLVFSVWSIRTRLWLLAGVVMTVVLAMGTRFFGGTYTYAVLFDYVPFFSSNRTPGRLVVWTTVLLGILAAGLVAACYELAAERMTGRPGRLVQLAAFLPVLLVLAEGTSWSRLDHPTVPKQPAAMATVEGPTMVMPGDAWFDETVMFWSTTKFQPMINGGSGFYPDDQWHIREMTKNFPDQESVDYLRQLGVRSVVLVKAQAGDSADYAKVASLDTPIDGLGIQRRDDGDTIIYTLN